MAFNVLWVFSLKKWRISSEKVTSSIQCIASILVENAFLYLKRWRGIATRYAKNAASFLAAIHIRCIALAISPS